MEHVTANLVSMAMIVQLPLVQTSAWVTECVISNSCDATVRTDSLGMTAVCFDALMIARLMVIATMAHATVPSDLVEVIAPWDHVQMIAMVTVDVLISTVFAREDGRDLIAL